MLQNAGGRKERDLEAPAPSIVMQFDFPCKHTRSPQGTTAALLR